MFSSPPVPYPAQHSHVTQGHPLPLHWQGSPAQTRLSPQPQQLYQQGSASSLPSGPMGVQASNNMTVSFQDELPPGGWSVLKASEAPGGLRATVPGMAVGHYSNVPSVRPSFSQPRF